MAEEEIDFDIRLKTQQAAADVKAWVARVEQEVARARVRVPVEMQAAPGLLSGKQEAQFGAFAGAGAAAIAIERVGRVMVTAEAALAGVEISLGAAHTIAGLLSGDMDKAASGAKEMEAAIKSIPVFGERIIRIGAAINNLFTGTADAVKRTEADIKKIDEHTTHLAATAKQTAQFNQQFGGFVAGIGPRADRTGLSDADALAARAADLRAQLARMLEDPGARNEKTGQLTEAAKAQANEAQRRIIAIETAGAEAVFRERMALTGQEEELRLRMIGDVAGAERQALINAHEAAIEAAKKKYPELIPIIDSIFEKQGQLLEKQLEEAQEKSQQRTLDTLMDIEEEFHRMHAAELDRQAKVQGEVDDMVAKANQIELRTAGKPREAELSAIQDEILADLVKSGGDEQREFAAARLGTARLRGFVAELEGGRERGRFEAVSASGTDLTARLSGKTGEDVADLRKKAGEMLRWLEQIANKPPTAVWNGD